MADHASLDAVINVRVSTLRESRSSAKPLLSPGCPSRPTAAADSSDTRSWRIQIALLSASCRRLGGLLKRVHTESGGAYSAETAQALADIRRCIERLAAS